MKIGMVTACYKPVINGVTRMVLLTTERLQALGHDVTVFTLGDPDPAGDDPWVIRSPGVPIGRTGYWFTLRYTRAAQTALQQMDVVHAHHLIMGVELARRYTDGPIVYTNHTRYDLYANHITGMPLPAAELMMRQAWPELTSRANAVIAPSESIRTILLEYGVQTPITVIANGVPLERYQVGRDAALRQRLGYDDAVCVTIYVGRLAEEKQLDRLLAIFAHAWRQEPRLRLLLIGDGPAAEELRELAQESGAEEAICFAGVVAYNEVAGWLGSADIFATTSVSEVHPVTVIEAMVSGLPIVAFDSPGILDSVTSGQDGLLIAESDPEAFSAALVQLARAPDQRRELGQHGRLTAQRFDIKSTIARTVALYQTLVD